MRIAVLGSSRSWYLGDLCRAAQDRHEIVSCTFAQLTSLLGENTLKGETPKIASQDVALNEVDGILVRTMAAGSLEQVVFRMDVLAGLEAAGKLIVNPPKAVETAVDKYLASAKLQAAGLRIPRTAVCQTLDDAMAAYQRLGGDVVLKPLFGAEGRGIARLNDEAMAYRAFQLLAELKAVIYLQEFIPHEGWDIRVLVIGRKTFAIQRKNPRDWRTNVSRGATAQPFALTDALRETALLAAAAVAAPFAGVDLLPGRDGLLYALEVNAVPGWRALGKTLNIDVAEMVLEYFEQAVSAFPRTENS